MKKFDVTELNYTEDWNELVKQVKEAHMMDITKRFKSYHDLIEGDPYLIDGYTEYYLTEIGIRNYFPIVVKVSDNGYGYCGKIEFALGW